MGKKRFSERMGITQPPTVQVDSMTDELKNSLWNFLVGRLGRPPEATWMHNGGRGPWVDLANKSAEGFFKVRVDRVATYGAEAANALRCRFDQMEWHRVYEFMEYFCENFLTHEEARNQARGAINAILEHEASGYRFVQGEVVPITNTAEIAAINEAAEEADRAGHGAAREHIRRALHLIAVSSVPDHHNSIKEAISAVESVCKVITGDGSGTLDSALKKLGESAKLHGALKDAFLKLYGYTSDEGGIRHANLGEADVGFDEAKFMVVSCSAFVHYLICKAEAAGLLGDG